MIAAFAFALAASSLSLSGFVPPHSAADGVRYRVQAGASADVVGAMRTCGIEDFAPVQATGGGTAYQFAVTRNTDAKAQCLHGRLARGARLEKIDSWIPNAQTD